MRTIKFRGKDFASNKWLFGDIRHHKNDVCIFEQGGNKGEQVKPETVGQFTGLTDKNGTPIYEGDIIGCDRPNIRHLVFYCENEARFMAALNGCIENAYFGVCGLDNRKWIATKEVIGNIHDNPELIEEGDNP